MVLAAPNPWADEAEGQGLKPRLVPGQQSVSQAATGPGLRQPARAVRIISSV
jgi:hypothetical protein